MFLEHRNQSIDFYSKSVDWCLYEGNLATLVGNIKTQTSIIRQSFLWGIRLILLKQEASSFETRSSSTLTSSAALESVFKQKLSEFE